MDSQKIGAFLRVLRKEKNLTQEQLAEILNVSGRTVSRWETGTNMPDLSIMIELADYYDIDVKELLNGERKSEMDKELKETLKTVAEYTDEQKKAAVKASNYGFVTIFIISAIAILIQMIAYMDMKLVIGETVAVLLGGMAYLMLIVRAGAWNYPKSNGDTLKKDLISSLACTIVFTVAFFFMLSKAIPGQELKYSLLFFIVIFAVSLGVLRLLSSISSKHTK
ncbi:Transcriptional regulator, contains XRE-family HTH domain [Butyrivibrio sp. ob235]|uniref:helix-turn-helix domain-containing protein n=1 Tax=Butyrivibrio sp. ob235 TaxID=1761780 RepID=UPI0008B2837C|nr:helix-turn-helix transcriptional regulator [Butyrivibrio sp. ob235]SEL28277.1 Transcriptional regulator, contains XRE-family HTH domain [Butyrivibrio sp. ob235]